MTALASLLVQLISLCAGIYLGFTGHLSRGIALAVGIHFLHWLASKLSNGLMLVHQKWLMSSSERTRFEFQAMHFGSAAHPPTAWPRIATACGVLFTLSGAAIIWMAVNAD